jgi:hypothetical protein
MDDRRTIAIGAAGTGARAWVLPGGYQIAGIKIDNKSGSWLLLPDGTFVPPYTISFGHSFQPELASIDVLFSDGPAGQVSTQQGDAPFVHIYSEPVGESSGIPSGGGTAFIQQFTPTVLATVSGTAQFSTGVFQNTLFLTPALKRVRLFSISVGLRAAFQVPAPNYISGSGFDWIIESGPGVSIYLQGHVGPPGISYSEVLSLLPGFDVAVNQQLSFSISPDWADVEFHIAALLQVI